jgi:prostaglandin-H2 D-isomerase / glutathione transferase
MLPASYFQVNIMSQLKLTYFDFHGGRAEPARLAMHIGNIAFEDYRFAHADLAAVRKSTPFGQVPTLHVDGVQVTQSDAITRYVGKLAGLYPADPFQALLCDEVMGAVEDAIIKMGPTYRMTGDALKEARTTLVNGPLTMYLGWLQNQLQAHGGEYFADQRLTIADLKVFSYVQGLNSGRLDHVPTDLVEKVAPQLNIHMNRVAQTPAVAQYYAQFGL